jgi:FixJ family two-component response regulator
MQSQHSAELLAILDDDKSFRNAMQDLIEAEGMSALCFSSAEQFWGSEARHTAACLIADVRMPGMSGLELQGKLNAERCTIPIIFVTGRGDIPTTVKAMKEGAIDFFTKPIKGRLFLAAVGHALEMDRIARRKAHEHADLLDRYRSLTPREQQVLPLLTSGLLNKQVAAELGITEYTVQIHRGHIMRKMKADSFATLVRMAERLDLHAVVPVVTVSNLAHEQQPELAHTTGASGQGRGMRMNRL